MPFLERVRAQRLSCDPGMGQRGQVVPFDSGVQEHPEHGRRAAERGDAVLLDLVHDVGGLELLELVDEYPSLHHPRGVQLAPCALDPSRVRDGEVQAVRVHAVPVLGGDYVRQRI